MVPGELCLITINPNGNLDVLRGPSPQDFSGSYLGIIREIDYAGSTPRVLAVFADPRITKDGNIQIAQLDDRQPPFPYTVVPRYRMQGVTNYNQFAHGQPCVVQIPDWEGRDDLLKNDGMSPDEILRIMPRELIGLWRGRIIFATTGGYEVEGGRLYAVAAVLDDERIRDHEDEAVRRWYGLEVPVRYVVRRPGLADFALEAERFIEDASEVIADDWRGLKKKAGELKEQLLGK